MKTYIEHHYGETDDEVLKILKSHPELWGDISFSDLCHTELFDVYDERGTLLGFFGNSHWNNGGCWECVLSYVYVKEEYRQKGIFKKMVRYTIEHNSDAKIISIGACELFWLGPGTPFILICTFITIGIKGLFNKIKSRKIKNINVKSVQKSQNRDKKHEN